MYSLMLVEDEPIVLEGMMKIIDFEALGFNVVSACSNGLEALEAYNREQPDVVVTDICMEIMDGLEFIEEVSQQNNHTKFVIISGHQDFKFFKKALSLKVTDYILKPVTAKEFRELLLRISDELKALQENNNHQVVNQFEEFVKVERNMFFNRFMHVKMNAEEVNSKLDSFGIFFDAPVFQTAIYKLIQLAKAADANGLQSADELLNLMYEDICQMLAHEEGVFVFLEPHGSVVVVANKKNPQTIQLLFAEVAKILKEKYLSSGLGSLHCYVGLEVDHALSLPKSYKSANRLNICGVLSNPSGLYLSEDILFGRANKRLDYSEQMEAWVRAMVFGDDESSLILEALFEDFYKANYLMTDLRVAAIRMQDYLEKELSLLNKSLKKPLFYNADQLGEDEVKDTLRQTTKEITATVGRSSTGKDSYIALKAVAYIENNYVDTDLDLTQVCQVLNVSVSYFSTVFKKHTTMTFVKYLNTYRIDKAKYLLEYSQTSISDVSEMVGFVDPHYFGIVFKKYALTTPKKYRVSQQ